VNYSYDYFDNLSLILTGTVSNKKQFFNYNTNPATGNLNYRKDMIRNITENFTYDNLNRLTDASIIGQTPISLTYQPNGNIDTKGDVGGYNYDPAKIHAVVELAGNPGTVPEIPQTITYTSFNKVKTVVEGDFSYLLKYGPDEERRVSELTDATTGVTTKKVYVGGYEIQSDGTNEKKTHYIMGNSGPVAMMVSENNTDNYYYFCKDHLGSVTGLLDQTGNMAEEYNYDAWGRRRNPTDWTYDNVPVPTLSDRGFTFHEHMDKFGLINMNGRVYDPLVGRMLSPDPMMQAAGNTQGLNRYSYCFNNPLKYVDPSGYHTAMPDMSYIQANFIYTGSGWIEPNYLQAMLTGDAGRYQDLVARGEIMGMPTAMLGSSFGDGIFNSSWSSLGNYSVERKIKYKSPSKMDKNSSYTEAFVFNVAGPGGDGDLTGTISGGAARGVNLKRSTASKSPTNYTKINKPISLLNATPFKQSALPLQVINYSKSTVFFKPDDNITINGFFYNQNGAYPIGPRKPSYIPIDGLNVNGVVTKVSNNYNLVIINSNGEVKASYSSLSISWFGYQIKGGVLSSPPDDGWNNLFKAIKK
jgi:RHS repeat-associated protein